MAKGTRYGFRECTNQYERIAKEIAARRWAPVYLLMGEEPYFIDRLTDALAENILTETERAFNQTVVYGKDTDEGAIVNLARQLPMMGGRQVVIVREAQHLRRIETLSLYTARPSASTVLILCLKGKTLDKRTQLYKQIASAGEVFESVRPRDYEIGPWLTNYVARQGCRIAPQALEMLVAHLGTDLTRIATELRKLLTYLPEGTPEITVRHIEDNIGISKDFNNFELTKALSERDAVKALLVADHFARNPKDNPLSVTLGVLFSHFQRIFILNYQFWLARRKGTPVPPDAELCRMLKLSSPFFLNEYREAVARYPNVKVFAIIGLLREYDAKSKGVDGGAADNGQLLRELLLRILTL